ncbi:hypothetical protein [Lentzea sp. HUAS12]|uniref:hypothetical protein n=1 Tax=Lentzea sp. HUAS12 TaxID=2951806 RepID=UPI0020A165BB|nr:hypothetical protein [Lentzea sp. HUAS12]USX50076.1 hypothetical protein ND450_32450 [Lentzea sp. HUAS12]
MNAELRNRLLACDLPVAGVESPAVAELAGEAPTQLRSEDATALFGRVVAELGLPRLTLEQADWIGYRGIALDVISGKITPDHWSCCVASVGALGRSAEVAALSARAFLDPDEVADEVLALARDLVRVADERIRGWTS